MPMSDDVCFCATVLSTVLSNILNCERMVQKSLKMLVKFNSRCHHFPSQQFFCLVPTHHHRFWDVSIQFQTKPNSLHAPLHLDSTLLTLLEVVCSIRQGQEGEVLPLLWQGIAVMALIGKERRIGKLHLHNRQEKKRFFNRYKVSFITSICQTAELIILS